MIKKFLLKAYLNVGDKIANFILDVVFNDHVCMKYGSNKVVNKLFVLANNFSLHLTTLRYNS
jgi:hypothetical protein